MNLETLLNLSNGNNLEIAVKVGDKIYSTARDWVEVEGDSLIVNVTQPIERDGETIKDQGIIEKLKTIGYEKDPVFLEDVLGFLRSKGIYIYVETISQRFGLVHQGNVVAEGKRLSFPEACSDYDLVLITTLKNTLELICS